MTLWVVPVPEVDYLPGKAGSWEPAFAVVGIAPSPNRPSHRKLEPFGSKSWTLISGLVADLEAVKGEGAVYLTNCIKEPLAFGKKPRKPQERQAVYDLYLELQNFSSLERILAVGDVPARALCGDQFSSLTEDHGTWFWNETLSCWVIPTFHFSAGFRDPSLRPIIEHDLERFMWEEPDPVPGICEVTMEALLKETATMTSLGEVVVDIETTGLVAIGADKAKITQVGLRYLDKLVYLKEPTSDDLTRLGQWLKRARVVVMHNGSFDISHLMAGSSDQSPWIGMENTADTMLCAHNQGIHSSLSLKHLMSMYTGLPGSRGGRGWSPDTYLAQDLQGTWALWQNMLRSEHAHHYSARLMSDLTPIMARMHVQGVYIDRGELDGLVVEQEEIERGLLDKLGRDVNWNSPNQVSARLLELGVPLKETTDSGNLSVAEAILLELKDDYPVVEDLLLYRATSKLSSGFLKPFQASGMDTVHPRLLLHGAETGRLSCRDPNLQQIPRTGKFKTIFKPRGHRDGDYWGLVDLSQAELRVAALISGDEAFAEALMAEDVHRQIASIVFHKPPEEITAAERKRSKGTTFGLLYGGSAAGLAVRMGSDTKSIEEVIKSFYGQFPVLAAWLNSWKKSIQQDGVTGVTTPFGRYRDLTRILHLEGPRGAYRKAVNTPIQGSASDIMLMVLRSVHRDLLKAKAQSRPIFTVHDSLMLEVVHDEVEVVIQAVQDAFRNLKACPNSPLNTLPLSSTLPIVGELVLGSTWAAVESTNEHYGPTIKDIPCSSLSA